MRSILGLVTHKGPSPTRAEELLLEIINCHRTTKMNHVQQQLFQPNRLWSRQEVLEKSIGIPKAPRGRKNQLLSWYIFFIVSGLALLCISSCNEEEIKTVPVVTTSQITDAGPFSVSCGGNISNDGSSTITARGVCWSTLPGPTIKDKRTIDGAGTGAFTSIIDGLKSNTMYYVRAYATNSEGTGYGNEISFTTKGAAPEAITESADKITPFTARLNTTINPHNLPTEVSFEYGTTPEYGNICLATKVPFTGGVRTKNVLSC